MKENKMNKLAAAATIVGAAALFTSAPAFAAELEPEAAPVYEYEENDTYESEEASYTEKDLEDAEQRLNAADDEFQQAAGEAYDAFNQAKEDATNEAIDAELEYQHLQLEHRYTQKAEDDAKEAMTEADEQMTASEEALQEAEKNLPDEDAIDTVESEISQAEAEVQRAEETYAAQDTVIADAEKLLDDASAELTDEAAKLEDIVRAKEDLQQQMAKAQEEADYALLILNNVGVTGDDSPAFLAAIEALSKAMSAQEKAEQKLTELEKQLDFYTISEMSAIKEMSCIDSALAEDMPTLEALRAEAEAAAADLQAKTQAATEATNTLAQMDAVAKEAQAERDQAKEVAESGKIDPAVTQAEATKAEADKKVENTKNELDKIKGTLDKASEITGQGFVGFIDWMLAKDDLTDAQRKDLKEAQEYLKEGLDHTYDEFKEFDPDFLERGHNMQITNMNDPQDAIALEKLKVSLGLMRDLDALRLQDENYAFMNPQASTTNFATMASAAVSADRAAGTFNHTIYHTMAEGLAWGYNPVGAWYNHEKTYVFDRIKDELGIAEVKNYDDLNAILNKADEKAEVVGHYAYLFLSPSVVMGVGHTDWNNTSSYGVTPADYVRVKYSFDEFEALLDEYMKTLDMDEITKKVEAAQDAYDQALTEQKAAADALSMIKAETGDAAEKLQAAEEKLAEATAALEQAKADKEAADAALIEAERVSKEADEAATQMNDRIIGLNKWHKTYEEQQAVAVEKRAELTAEIEDQKTEIDDLKKLVAEKTAAFDLLDIDEETALDNYNKAVDRTVEIYEALKAKGEEETQAQADYASKKEAFDKATAMADEARQKKDEALGALEAANAVLAEKEALLDTLKKGSADYAEAKEAYEGAKQLQKEALENLEAAQANNQSVGQKLAEAEKRMDEAHEKLQEAMALEYEGVLTPVIMNDTYAYLNKLIEKVVIASVNYKTAEQDYATIYQALATQKPGNNDQIVSDDNDAEDKKDPVTNDDVADGKEDKEEDNSGDVAEDMVPPAVEVIPGGDVVTKPEAVTPGVPGQKQPIAIEVGMTEVSVMDREYNILNQTGNEQMTTPKTGDESKPMAAAAGMTVFGAIGLAGVFDALKRRNKNQR